jgi:tetratricopeptide (TPR) repeat protein
MKGIELWNITAMAMKCEPVSVKKILCSVKFFACLLLLISGIMNQQSLKLKFRCAFCFVKVLKAAIDEEDLSLAQKIQEHADREYQVLESMTQMFEKSTQSEFVRLRVELFIIKMQMSIIEGDVEMAKLYQERSGLSVDDDIDERTLLDSARVIFNTCLILHGKKSFDGVVYFLNKIMTKVKTINLEGSKDIKCSIFSLLANTCFELNTTEALSICSTAVEYLQEVDPATLDSFKLDIKLKRIKNSHPNEIENSIIQMLMTVQIVANFKNILSIINEHAILDPLSAINCYEFAMTNKLDPGTDQEALEMLMVAMINAYIKDQVTPVDIRQEKLRKFFDVAERIFVKSISKRTSSTSVTLLWTAGKKDIKNKKYEDATYWFKLTLHRLIQISDDDKAKVQRALQNCYINTEDYEQALNVYSLMDDNGKKSLITQYNLFKIYVALHDETKLMEALKRIAASNDKLVIPLLSLCAINTGSNSRIAIEAMLKLFKIINQQDVSGISVPKTLRCVIELILKEPETDAMRRQYTETLYTLLSEAQKFASNTQNNQSYRFTVDELKWFASQSFNISRQCLIDGDVLNGQLISAISVEFNNLITDDISIEESITNKLWKYKALLIEIMCTSKMTTISNEVLWGTVRQKSLNLRVLIDESRIIHQNRIDFDKFQKDWDQSLMDATLFQFQSELELGNWSASKTIVNETMKIKSIEFDSTLVNILIEEKFPEMIKAPIISMIIEKNISVGVIDGSVLSRWVRLLLKNSLSSFESEQSCLKVLDKIINRMRSQSENENRLPAHEIEWISSTCWNNGVSRMFNENKAGGKNWCLMAIKLSSFVNERFEATLIKLWDELSTSV